MIIEETLKIPEANKIVKRFASKANKGKAIDIGLGGGRDALYMGCLGYDVDAVDISTDYSEICNKLSEKNNLNVKSRCEDCRVIEIKKSFYDLITSAWILHSLKKTESHTLINKLIDGLVSDGMIIISVFSVDDPFFKLNYNPDNKAEENTFYSEERKSNLHYFTKPEILELFSGLELIYFCDSITLDTGHGLPHYHGIIEYVGKKK